MNNETNILPFLQEQPTYPSTNNSQQSRLNQWKLPALDKESPMDPNDFSRAPGTTAKSTLSTGSSTMSTLGLQGDG